MGKKNGFINRIIELTYKMWMSDPLHNQKNNRTTAAISLRHGLQSSEAAKKPR